MNIDFVQGLVNIFPQWDIVFGTGFLIFVRILGLFRFAPGFNRKEVPGMIKLTLAFALTIVLVGVIKPSPPPADALIFHRIIINYSVGALIGYIAYCILAVIEAGGDMINTQMGLSSAMVLDPTTSAQVSVVGRMLGLLGLSIFCCLGGLYWILEALIRSFEIFPVYGISVPLEKIINIDYLVKITSNVLYIGLQFASPILLATLGQDIILGIISKTAPQINVFTLSFLFKPVLGALLLSFVLPVLYNVITDYFLTYSGLF